MAGNALVLTFEIFDGNAFLRREELTAESVTIGKGPAAMLRIEHAALQDLHAVLNVNEDGSVQLLDLVGDGSTKVNNASVSNVLVSSGDVLGVGSLRVIIRVTDAAAFDDDEATKVDVLPTPSAPVAAAAPALAAAAAAAPAAPVEPAAFDDEDAPVEDVMAFVMRASAIANEANADRSRGKVLEVAQVFGDSVLDMRLFSTGMKVRLSGKATDSSDAKPDRAFFVAQELIPEEGFAIFENNGGRWVCNFSEKWAGFLDQGDTRRTLAELLASGAATRGASGLCQIAIGENDRLIIDLGHTLFMAHMVFPGKKAVAVAGQGIDWPFLAIVGFMGIVAMIFASALVFVKPPQKTENNDIDRLAELLIEKKQEEPPPEPKKEQPKKNPDAGEGAKAKKEEGKVGKKDAKMEQAKGEKKQMDRQQLDKEIAADAGVLGALNDNAALDNALGATGMNSAVASGIGGMIGGKGTQAGSGGLGNRGGGVGGGGSADGLGGMGTKGRGSGSSGYGTGGGDFGKKSEGGIGRVGGDPIILGALDRSLIDAVIKKNMASIRYCYQRELNKNPNLGGKITVKFVIAKDGTVSSASIKSSTMGSAAVESCITGRFARFQFPEPKGGGIVMVSYPFIFSPG